MKLFFRSIGQRKLLYSFVKLHSSLCFMGINKILSLTSFLLLLTFTRFKKRKQMPWKISNRWFSVQRKQANCGQPLKALLDKNGFSEYKRRILLLVKINFRSRHPQDKFVSQWKLSTVLTTSAVWSSGINLIKLLGAYLSAWLSQVNGARRLNKRLKVL